MAKVKRKPAFVPDPNLEALPIRVAGGDERKVLKVPQNSFISSNSAISTEPLNVTQSVAELERQKEFGDSQDHNAYSKEKGYYTEKIMPLKKVAKVNKKKK